MNSKVRNSNFELMRIISMLFIVIYHVRMHSGFNNATGSVAIFLNFITTIMVVHVNSFVLISGYYQSKSKVKLSKAISINNAAWFYKVLFLIIALVLTRHFSIALTDEIKPLEIIKTLLPFDYGIYWFVDCYLALYLISPILNKLIDSLSKKNFQKILAILFILLCIIPTITLDEVIFTRGGHSITSFIFLYLLGAYLRIYPVKENYYFRRLTDTGRQALFIIVILITAIVTLFCNIVAGKLIHYGTASNYLGYILNNFYINYGSPLIVIESVAYFLFFETLNFKSKFINFISRYTFGVYLVHENIYVRDNIYRWLGLADVNVTIKTMFLMFGLGMALFIISMLIEIVRQAIFKFIYNRKISCKFRKLYQGYFQKLGLDLNW